MNTYTSNVKFLYVHVEKCLDCRLLRHEELELEVIDVEVLERRLDWHRLLPRLRPVPPEPLPHDIVLAMLQRIALEVLVVLCKRKALGVLVKYEADLARLQVVDALVTRSGVVASVIQSAFLLRDPILRIFYLLIVMINLPEYRHLRDDLGHVLRRAFLGHRVSNFNRHVERSRILFIKQYTLAL